MKVRYTDTALAEIEAISNYIAQDNPKAAGEVTDAIERTIAWIIPSALDGDPFLRCSIRRLLSPCGRGLQVAIYPQHGSR